MYKIEGEKPFCSTLKFLNLIVVFPMKLEKSHFRRFFIKFCTIRIICFIVCCVLPAFHLVTSVKDGIIIGISEDMSIIVGSAGALTTSYLFIFQTIKWSQFFCDVTDFRTFGKHSSFDNVKNRMNLFSRIYFYYIFVGTFVYAFIAYTDTSYCKDINALGKSLHEICGAFMQTRLPFDGNVLWIKLPIFFIQMSTTFLALVPGALLCFMAFEATEILITHVYLLKELLVQIFDTRNVQERSNRLRFCVKYHQHILRLADNLSYLVKFTSGHMSLISAIVFACIGNQIFKVKPFGALLFLIGYVVALFFLCHAGQRIIDETFSIGFAVYDSKWYEADAKMMRDVLLILFRSQKPSILEAVPFGSVNYPLFILIIKTSYSYLTLLNQST